MAQFASFIAGEPIAAGLPSDWTQVNGTIAFQVVADATSSGVSDRIFNTSSVTSSGDLTWNTPGTVADLEVLVLIKLASPLSFPTSATMVWARHSGVALTGYTIVFNTTSSSGGTSWQLGWNNGGSLTLLGSSVTFTWSADTWYFVRLRVSGVTLSGSAWALGNVEPTGFQASAFDSNLATGKAGLRCGSTNFINIAFFSAASGTDSAPSVPGKMVVPR